MKFMGIDLHTNCFTCCTLYEDERKEMQTFRLEEKSLKEFYETLTYDTYVLIEATINTFKFAQNIEDKVKEVIVSNTYQLKLISFTNKKTDKVDALKLARILKMQILSREEQIGRVVIPPDVIQSLRALFSTYNLMSKQKTALKNRIHSLFKQNLMPLKTVEIFSKRKREFLLDKIIDSVFRFQVELIFKQLDNIEVTIKELKERILVEGATYIDDISILVTMPGISIFAAIAIISDIITVKRFSNSKKFVSYLRSAPKVDSSNEKTIVKNTNKMGRKQSICFVSQSLNHFIDSNYKISHWYNKLGLYKKKGKIRMGACRRMLTVVYQMLKHKKAYYYINESLYMKKMTEYYRLLDKYSIKYNQTLKIAS